MFGQAADVYVTDASYIQLGNATKSTKERKSAQAVLRTMLRVYSPRTVLFRRVSALGPLGRSTTQKPADGLPAAQKAS
jgi:hypothetical protein